MCDMQQMPAREDASCDEDSEMNFAAFQAVGGSGTHFVTTAGQMPMAKLQQNVAGNGSIQQVVGMVEGVQYVQQTPQVISVPISLPGSKPGDPQPTVQIQVLNPNILQQQQQPKYQMQIPIQGFQQGGAVLTVAYSPDANDGSGIQLLQNTLPEGTFRMRTGVQVLTMPQEMQLVQQQPQVPKEEHSQIQQVFITPTHQIVINNPDDNKLNNNTSSNNNNNVGFTQIIVKEECDDNITEECPETGENMSWAVSASSHADLVQYLNTLPPQQAQALPASLQQFLRLNPEGKKVDQIDIQVTNMEDKDSETEAVMDNDGTLKILNKKKKKYKKKTPKPARPKPGQVVIATSSDGKAVFCCPECDLAYPEKEQLEMHLIVHKVERRFICGLCGAGLKRKEHLERHKLGHNPERPYVCGVCRKGFKRREHLNLHTVIHSGVKTEMCGECGKGFYRKDHLRKHTRSHEAKRARDEAQGVSGDDPPAIGRRTTATETTSNNSILPEITIHVPTSANMAPVQINIPQHMVTSLAQATAQAHTHTQTGDAHNQLEALLAHHS